LDLHFEIYNEDGVFYKSTNKRDFDFAHIDTKYNLMKLWNLCFGRKALHNGELHWKKTSSEDNSNFLKSEFKNTDWDSYNKGKDIDDIKKSSLTILGELQFGNWALVYRDLFKLLHADTNSGVDLFIYITAYGNLLSYASKGIVSYGKTIKILNEFNNIIKTPIWVIGLDIEF